MISHSKDSNTCLLGYVINTQKCTLHFLKPHLYVHIVFANTMDVFSFTVWAESTSFEQYFWNDTFSIKGICAD